jgi:hypothetical protein
MPPNASTRGRSARTQMPLAPDPAAPALLCALVSLTFAAVYNGANRWTSVRNTIGHGVFDWER